MTARIRAAESRSRPPRTRRYVLVALLIPVVLGTLLFWLRTEYLRSEALRWEAAGSYERRIEQMTLLARLEDADAAQRGFLLTGNPEFLNPLEPARRGIAGQLAAADATPAGSFQRAHNARVKRLVAAHFAEMRRTISAMRTGDAVAARRIVAAGRGKRLMEALRREIGTEINREKITLNQRRMAFAAQRRQLRGLVVAVVIALGATMFGILLVLWRASQQRHRHLTDAFEAAKRNAMILDSTIDAILILNAQGEIVVMNAAAVGLLGFGVDPAHLREIASIVQIAPGPGTFHQRIGLRGGKLDRTLLTDRWVTDGAGMKVPVDVAMGVMPALGGDNIVISLRDISERKRIDALKDELMSTVSHELRTPLTSIVGSLGLLRAGASGPLAPDAGRLVDIAENNSHRLIRLINDMLDIDRIESGKLQLAREPIDLRDVLEQAHVCIVGTAQKRLVSLGQTVPDRPVMISGDADRLQQVITNLLSNAIRVAPSGSAVELSLSVDDAGCALVTIDDRGPGVPTAFRARIFGRFERAARDDGATGTGLGLAISRDIVTRHHGRIWFEDRAGGGTRFAFTVAVLGSDLAVVPRVLLCCAPAPMSGLLAAMIVAEGGAFDLVRSAADALDAVSARSYRLVVIDRDLPGPDSGPGSELGGVVLARALRARDSLADLPIALVSDRARPAELDGATFEHIDQSDPDQFRRALQHAFINDQAVRPVVLHLDDDRDLLCVVAAALEPEVRVVTATDLESARAIIDGATPDAVILDVQLADGSALDLLPLLVDAKGRTMPTIVYSSHDLAGRAPEVDATLVKARDSLHDLKATVHRLVTTRGERSARR